MFIRILRDHYQKMLNSVEEQLPNEACGLLAGYRNNSIEVFPIENKLHSPVRFLMEPKQQLNVLLAIEEKGWDLLAIYHSHPQGPETPSETDVNENYYPQTPSIIWSKGEEEWVCKGYLIVDRVIMNIEIEYI